MQIRVTPGPGTRGALAKLSPESAALAVHEGGRDWAAVLERAVKEQTPGTGPGRTGATRRGWVTSVERDGDNTIVGLSNPLPTAVYLEYGTGIYGPTGRRIFPKTKKALAFKAITGARILGVRTGRMLKSPKMMTGMFVRRSIAGMRPQRPLALGFQKSAGSWPELLAKRIELMFGGGK